MKPLQRFILPILLVFAFLASAGCTYQRVTPTTAPTPDVNATVNAAVAATEAAQVMMQATIDQAVQSTASLIPTSVITAVIVITPIPSPTPVDAYTLSEEELAAIIDQSVNEAISAYETATAATQQAYQDGSLSSEELEAAYYAYAYAEDEIEAALALADEYLALYAELGEETIALLTAIEEDLSAMASAAEAASATLNEIYANVQAGVQVTQQNIEQLQQQVEQAAANAQQMHEQAGAWQTTVKNEISRFEQQFGSLQPNQIAADRLGSIQMCKDYLATVRSALQDNKLTRDEMNVIAQLGANASASVKQFQAPEMANLANKIEGMTHQLSRGELPQARGGLGEIERSIPRR
ncbi:MAG: hypothetical protein HPY45_15320 [Anaerolineae bacterium]|nr:hypothetical protein [Anaerolineae bacterium]